MNVQQRNGLSFTGFNRTFSDTLANESLLDMQGITEAISRYYYANGESFEGIFVAPEYQERFAVGFWGDYPKNCVNLQAGVE